MMPPLNAPLANSQYMRILGVIVDDQIKKYSKIRGLLAKGVSTVTHQGKNHGLADVRGHAR
jgi:hypothetical protein